jgi:hypothetical protein
MGRFRRIPAFVPLLKMCFDPAPPGGVSTSIGVTKAMLGKLSAGAALLVLSVAPAFADAASCVEPYPPAQVDGSKATSQQMKDAIQDFKTFQAASDDYQSCLINDLHQQEADAAKQKDPKPLDPSVAAGVNAKVDANQRMKEKVGGELNASIQAYKTAHPGG